MSQLHPHPQYLPVVVSQYAIIIIESNQCLVTASSIDSVYGTAADLSKAPLLSRSGSCSTVEDLSLNSLTGSLCNLLSSRNPSKDQLYNSNSISSSNTSEKTTSKRPASNGEQHRCTNLMVQQNIMLTLAFKS